MSKLAPDTHQSTEPSYAAFEAREGAAVTALDTLELADAVMAELADRGYVRKLLEIAEERVAAEGWDFSRTRRLIEGVARHLGDDDWAARLLTDAGGRAQGSGDLSAVAQAAVVLLPDADRARALVRGLLDAYQHQAQRPTHYDLCRLAIARDRLLGDTDGAARVLDQAAERGGSHFTFAELARVAGELGLADQMRSYLDRAGACCTSADQARQLAGRLLNTGFSGEQVRAVYRGLGQSLGEGERLAWADGIVDLFGDRAWAGEERLALGSAAGAETGAAPGRQRATPRHA